MKFHSTLPFRRCLLTAGLLAYGARRAAALSQSLCSGENTGSDYDQVYNIYNSNGACSDQCNQGNYAYAIVQYQNCWCSNYTPSDQQSVGSCSEDCPGYPFEKCGSEDDGLFGYIELNAQPSGTAGAGSSSEASSTQAPSTSTEPVSTSSSPSSETTETSTSSSDSFPSSTAPAVSTVTSTSTAIATASTTSSEPSTESPWTSELTSSPSQSSTEPTSTEPTSTSLPPTSTSTTEESSYEPSTSSYVPPTTTSTTSSTAEPTTSTSETLYVAPAPVPTTSPSSSTMPSATPSPMTSVRVVTVSGARVTETVTSTPMVTPGADAQGQEASLERKGLSDGEIAGAVVGSLLGVAAVLIGAFLLWRRKKGNDGAEGAGSSGGPTNPKRNVSVLSKTGLLSRARPVSVTEKEYDEPLFARTGNNSVRHSMLHAGGEGVSPVSPLGGGGGSQYADSQRRHSRPMVYDQRLNPSALFANHDNGSRVSIQDNADYSRPLGVMNPDPRPSVDSRNSNY